MKIDAYSQARGGWSRIFDISCEKCSKHICYYQKDGPGPLKRMYIDRIKGSFQQTKIFTCPNCGYVLGAETVYKKENRPAYRLFQDSVKKKIIRQSETK